MNHTQHLPPALRTVAVSVFIEVAELQESLLKLSGRVKQAEGNQLMCNQRQKKYIQKRFPLIFAALPPFVSFSPKLFPLKMTEGNMSLRTEMTIANGRCFH